MSRMKVETAHRIRAIFDRINWEDFTEEQGQELLKFPEFLGILLNNILSGKIKIDTSLGAIHNDTGRVELK